jgi:cyanophycinase
LTTFLLLGSGEFERWSADVERRALEAAPRGPVLVAPAASATEGDAVFDRWARMGLEHYEEMGLEAELLAMRTREDAERAELVEQIDRASMVFFSGGKPAHLAKVLDGSAVWEALLRALARGAVYAGCSAGAMVASQRRKEGSGSSSWTFGLGLVPNVSFGAHWDRMKYMPGARTFMMARAPRGTWFVGIDERTTILGDGVDWEVAGRGVAMVRHEGVSTTYAEGERFRTPPPHPGGIST